MDIYDATDANPIYCENSPGDDVLKREGGTTGKAFKGERHYFDAAVSFAKDLAQRLGPRWRGYVHYNLGWHYCALSPTGSLKVYEDDKTKRYSSLFVKGSMFVGRGLTPQAAVRDIFRQVDDEISKLRTLSTQTVQS